MEVDFLNTNDLHNRLEYFIKNYDEFHWAVAWGGSTSLTTLLFENSGKFRKVTFGVAFSHTDPDIVDALVGVRNAYVATKFSDGTYHPKVYGFKSGNCAAAIIGSANFTHGGLSTNREAALSLIGKADEEVFVDILHFAKESACYYGEAVTKDYARAYRASWKRAASLRKPQHNPVSTTNAGSITDMQTMKWEDYVHNVRNSESHDVTQSLKLLGTVRGWFAENPSFKRGSCKIPEMR